MKRTILNSLYGAWLGLSLGIIGVSAFSWEFYLVLIPTVILVTFFHKDSL